MEYMKFFARWYASIDEEPVVDNDPSSSSTMNIPITFNFQTIGLYAYCDGEEVFEAKEEPLVSRFICFDFGDLKQGLLAILESYGPEDFKEDVADAIIQNAREIARKDEKKALVITIKKYVAYIFCGSWSALECADDMLDAYLPQGFNEIVSEIAIMEYEMYDGDGDDDEDEDEDEGGICKLCHEEFEVGLNVPRLQCSHVFHSNCIWEWLERSYTCPVCHYKLFID